MSDHNHVAILGYPGDVLADMIVVAGIPHLGLPWFINESSGFGGSNIYPFGLDPEDAGGGDLYAFAYRRIGLRLAVSVTGDEPELSVSDSMECTRFTDGSVPVTDEGQTLFPGADYDCSDPGAIVGPTFWNGNVAVGTPEVEPWYAISAQVRYGFYGDTGGEEEALSRCIYDPASGLFYPSFAVSVGITGGTPGTEFSYQVVSYTPDNPGGDPTVGGTGTLDGRSFAITGVSAGGLGIAAASVTIDLIPGGTNFLSWNGKWHTTTGAALRDHRGP